MAGDREEKRVSGWASKLGADILLINTGIMILYFTVGTYMGLSYTY